MPTDKVRAAILAIQAQQSAGRLPKNITIFDFETTHLGVRLPYGEPRPVELAALRIEPGKPFQTFQTLVDPVIPMDPGAIATHGIQESELIGAPSVREALGRFGEFSKGSTLVAHNAPFDIRVLELERQRVGLPNPPTVVVDTLRAARGQLSGLGRGQYNLGKLAKRLGLEVPTHRAMADVWTTTQLFHMASKEASGLMEIEGEKDTIFTIGKVSAQPLRRRWSTWKKAALFGLGVYGAYKLFSGFDDDYNTIEGMKHGGIAAERRRLYTDFGSGKNRLGWFIKAAEGILTKGKQKISSVRQEVSNMIYDATSRLEKYAEAAQANRSKVKAAVPVAIEELQQRLSTETGFSVRTIRDLATVSQKMTPQEFADLLGVKLTVPQALENLIKNAETSLERQRFLFQSIGFGLPNSSVYQGTPVEELMLSTSRKLGASFGEAYVNPEAGRLLTEHMGLFETDQRVLDEITKTIIFHEAAELRISNRLGTEGILKTLELNAKRTIFDDAFGKPPIRPPHEATVVQEELFTRSLRPFTRETFRHFRVYDAPWFSGFHEEYNTIEGLRHGGVAEWLRKVLTEFGSGKDRARWFARAAGEVYETFLAGSVFQKALSEGKVVRELGSGVFGRAELMMTYINDEPFWFVRKTSTGQKAVDWLKEGDLSPRTIAQRLDFRHEAEMMRPFQEGLVPTVYRANENELIMEYARGAIPLSKLTQELPQSVRDQLIKEAEKAIELGIYNPDIHPENLLYNPATKTPYWIDFGMARREPTLSKYFMRKEMVNFGMAIRWRPGTPLTTGQLLRNEMRTPKEKGYRFDGLPHGGEAEKSRLSHSDFSSPWRGLFGGISRKISKWMARGVKEGAEKLLDPRKAAQMARGVGLEEFIGRLHKETGIEVMLIRNQEERMLVNEMIMKGAGNLEAAQQAIAGLQGGAGFFSRRLLPATKRGAIVLDPERLASNFGIQSEELAKTALYHEVLEQQTVRRFKDLRHTQGHYGAQVLVGEGAFVREMADQELQQTMLALRKGRGKQEHAAFLAGFEAFTEQGASSALRKLMTDFGSGYRGHIQAVSRRITKELISSSGINQEQLSDDLNRAKSEIWYNANYGGRRHTQKSHQMVKHFTQYGGGVGN